MKSAALNPRFIARMRFFRAVLDCLMALLALAAMGVLLQRQPVAEPRHKKHMQLQQVRPVATDKLTPVYLENSHVDEAGLWKAWTAWIQSEKPATGHCLFKTVADTQTDEGMFHLRCFGLLNEKATPAGLPAEGLFDKPLFANQTVSHRSKAKSNSANAKISERNEHKESVASAVPKHVTRGWIDTETGRKHYNAEKRTWQVAP
jgi:hypothetical protein